MEIGRELKCLDGGDATHTETGNALINGIQTV